VKKEKKAKEKESLWDDNVRNSHEANTKNKCRKKPKQ
jgi:hypothetical protein